MKELAKISYNTTVVRIFRGLSRLYAWEEDFGRAKAFDLGARVVEKFQEDVGLMTRDELMSYYGIGPSLADACLEIAATGTCERWELCREDVEVAYVYDWDKEEWIRKEKAHEAASGQEEVLSYRGTGHGGGEETDNADGSSRRGIFSRVYRAARSAILRGLHRSRR